MSQITVDLSKQIKNEFIFTIFHQYDDTSEMFQEIFETLVHKPLRLRLNMNKMLLYDNIGIPYAMCSKSLLVAIHALLRSHYEQQETYFKVKMGLQGYTLMYESFKYNALLDQNISRIALFNQLFKCIFSCVPKGKKRKVLYQMVEEKMEETIGKIEMTNHPLKKKLKSLLSRLKKKT